MNTENNFESNLSNTPETTIVNENPKPVGLSIASMVCGIVSIVLCCSTLIPIILSIVSLCLGGVALKKKHRGRGMAIAGIVCSVITLALNLIVYLYALATGVSLLTLFS